MQAIAAPITETYADVQKLIWHTCHRFARRNGGDVEEYVAEANVVYLKVYESWSPNMGTKFSGYLVTCIWRRLIGVRNHARRHKPVWHASLDVEQPNGRTMASQVVDDRPEYRSLYDLVATLSADAAAVVQLVVDAPADLLAVAQGKGGQPRNWASSLRTRLRKAGWEPKRITETFEEIAGALV
jgi:DNA-directed RNA polymerase specialized sigma24 family protein